MNITELARRVHIPTKQLREIMPYLGFDIGGRAIKVDDRIASAVIQKLNSKAKREKVLREVFGEKESDTDNAKQSEKPKQEGEIELSDRVVVKDLAKKMNTDVTKLVIELMRQGVMVSLNDSVDYETAAIVAQDFGFSVVPKTGDDFVEEKSENVEKLLAVTQSDSSVPRPPVVVVMGHVDHGKTKLLDSIRASDVAAKESGGITQHIGAYQVEVSRTETLKDVPVNKLTLIDTPGHEAFSMMRSRGARIADIAILVVAADDGVQPQTIEAISHIKKAELPFVVAINKIDKQEANPDKIRSKLAELGLNPEEWGGDTIMVEISALKGTNIDKLLETLLLVYEMNKENIKADPNGEVLGTVIESHVDKGSGAVATILIQNGTLKVGDNISVGGVVGRVRSMKDWVGNTVQQAPPSMPVAILGLKGSPRVGEIMSVGSHKREARKQAKKLRRKTNSQALLSGNVSGESSDIVLSLIIKADVLGSLEALRESLGKLDMEDAHVSVVSQGLGYITEVDVLRAVDTGALILGFNAYATPEAEALARTHDIEIKSFEIIYDFLDFVSKQVSSRLSPEVIKTELGRFKILKVFRRDKDGIILGGKVVSGELTDKASLELLHGGVSMGTGSIIELQSGKETVTQVTEGQEAGIHVKGFEEIEPGDEFVVFDEKEKTREIVL